MGYRIPFMTLPPLNIQGPQTIYSKGSEVVGTETVSKVAIEPARLLHLSALQQGNEGG